MKMTTGKIIAIVVVVLIVLLAIVGIGNYNSLVSSRNNVENQAANIDTQLQRRVDLIPNLVETVKGYASQEADVIQSVSDARAALAGASTIEEKSDANAQVDSALSRLLVVVENYPDLKSNENYIALMDELSGTENRIQVARKDYNDAVRTYNEKIQRFPANIFAGLFGFKTADYFEAAAGAEVAPTVNFSTTTAATTAETTETTTDTTTVTTAETTTTAAAE